MVEYLCKACEFFSPALSCIEKPRWGHCMRLIKAQDRCGPGPLQPRFTWADSHCDDFQPRQSSPIRR